VLTHLKARKMKKILIALVLVTGGVTLTPAISQAQVSVNVNIGSQPLWGPTGYDYADYYYMPDVDAYYSISNQQFIYMDAGRWVFRASLPGRYRNFDLYNGYKVVINDRNPWLRNDYYRNQYWGYRGRHNQPVIRDSRDYRYYQVASHPYHNQWRGPRNDGGYRADRGSDRSRGSAYDRRDNRGYDRQDNRGYDRNNNRGYQRNDNRGDRSDNRGYQGTRGDGVQVQGDGSANGRAHRR